MEVELTDDAKKLLEQLVHSGRFASASEALEEGLRVLADEDEWSEDELDEETLAAIEEGERQLDAGERVPWEQVKAEVERKFGFKL